MGGGATRERGRPARMHSRSVPLSFPATRHPATLPAGTAWARQARGGTYLTELLSPSSIGNVVAIGEEEPIPLLLPAPQPDFPAGTESAVEHRAVGQCRLDPADAGG